MAASAAACSSCCASAAPRARPRARPGARRPTPRGPRSSTGALDAVHLEGRTRSPIRGVGPLGSIWRRSADDGAPGAPRARRRRRRRRRGRFAAQLGAAPLGARVRVRGDADDAVLVPAEHAARADAASAGVDFYITLWDVASGEPMRKLREHRDFVTSLLYLDRSAMFASASLDRTVIVWSLQHRKCARKRVLRSRQPVKKLSATADVLVTCGLHAATVYDLALGSRVCDVGAGHRAPLVGAHAVAFIDHVRGPQQRCVDWPPTSRSSCARGTSR